MAKPELSLWYNIQGAPENLLKNWTRKTLSQHTFTWCLVLYWKYQCSVPGILANILGQPVCVKYTFSNTYSSLKRDHFTADVSQPWANYVNDENEYLSIGAVVCPEYSNT